MQTGENRSTRRKTCPSATLSVTNLTCTRLGFTQLEGSVPWSQDALLSKINPLHTLTPYAADGGDGLQICKVAANILNKQSRTDEKKWSSS